MKIQNTPIYNEIFKHLNMSGYDTREIFDNEKVMKIVAKMVKQQVITYAKLEEIKNELQSHRRLLANTL